MRRREFIAVLGSAAASLKRMVENVHALTTRSWTWQQTTELVTQLNRTLSE